MKAFIRNMKLFGILRAFDRALFIKINQVWTHPVLDAVMPVVTDLNKHLVFWVVLAVVAGAWIWRQRALAVKIMIALILTVGFADALAHRVIKPAVHRARPERAGISCVLRNGSHSGYSFPSNHALNMFVAASFLSPLYPSLTIPLYAAAAVISYSRVYVGVHFPFDVICGALLGFVIGRLAVILLKRQKVL